MGSVSPPDLLITDISLPEMDGWQLTRANRGNELVKGGRIPIIGLTAGSGCSTKTTCPDAGMDEYLNKSVDTDALNRLINNLQQKIKKVLNWVVGQQF